MNEFALYASRLILLLFATVFLYLIMLFVSGPGRAIRRQRYRQSLRRRSLEQQQMLREQMSKRSFDDRLKDYSESECQSSPSFESKMPESKMTYWEIENLSIERTLPRPIEYIRSVLKRLAKYFNQNAAAE